MLADNSPYPLVFQIIFRATRPEKVMRVCEVFCTSCVGDIDIVLSCETTCSYIWFVSMLAGAGYKVNVNA